MKWYRTDQKLPENGQEVLIRFGEDYYLAEYREEDWIFVLKAGGYLPIKGIFWTALSPPAPLK
jgi:hypothetical protein